MANNLAMDADRRCRFFALGRNAMVAACRAAQITSCDEILTPAYDCDGALQPFRVFRAKLIFYRVKSETFEVDVDDLKKRITQKTKLIHLINYFGFSQPWDELLRLRKEFQIPLLEDNAYSLFSTYQNQDLGTFGDFSIFSLRKNLPLLEGGMLRINDPIPSLSGSLGLRHEWLWPRDDVPYSPYNGEIADRSPKFLYRSEWSGLLKYAAKKMGLQRTPSKRIWRSLCRSAEPPPPLYSDPAKGAPEWAGRDQIGSEFECDTLRPMSRLARFQLSRWRKEDLIWISKKKREYYQWLSDQLKPLKGIQILWPQLPEGVVPFCFSMLIWKDRDLLFQQLRKKYDVMAWPTLSQLVIDRLSEFPEVEYLGRHLLQFNLSVETIWGGHFERYLEGFVSDLKVFFSR